MSKLIPGSNAKGMNAKGVALHLATREEYYQVMDALPKELRMFIADAPYSMSCFDFQKMLSRGYSVESILSFAKQQLATIVKAEVAATYGKDHPQA